MTLVLKKGFFCIVEKEDNETTEETYKRGWFMVSQINTNTIDTNELVKYSKLWKNYKQHNCIYNSDIMNKLVQCEGNIFSVQSDFNH